MTSVGKCVIIPGLEKPCLQITLGVFKAQQKLLYSTQSLTPLLQRYNTHYFLIPHQAVALTIIPPLYVTLLLLCVYVNPIQPTVTTIWIYYPYTPHKKNILIFAQLSKEQLHCHRCYMLQKDEITFIKSTECNVPKK